MLNESYDPLIEAARHGTSGGHDLLRSLGNKLYTANKDRMSSIEDGIRTAKMNLAVYAQFFPCHVQTQVRVYYGLDGKAGPEDGSGDR